jgi:hypothetical protein
MQPPEVPLSMRVAIGQKCSPTCSSVEIQTVTVGRIQQPDPKIRQYSYSGNCAGCRGERVGFFFVLGDDLSVEIALNAAEASRYAQEMVNAWGVNMKSGNSNSLTPEFMDVFEKACQYQSAKQQADSHRQLNILSETNAEAEETATRLLFAEAFTKWCEKHKPVS